MKSNDDLGRTADKPCVGRDAPEPVKFTAPLPSRAALAAPDIDTNASITTVAPGKTEVRFPEDGYLRMGRHEFRDPKDLAHYVHSIFELRQVDGQIRFSMTRKGRYRRLDHDGQRVFTFGDPVLDLITDATGCFAIGDQLVDMAKISAREGQAPRGVLSVNSPITEADIHAEAVRAAMGASNFILTECEEGAITLVSRNPKSHIVKFMPGVGTAELFAWRINGWFYWSLGADLEVTGKKFLNATIEGAYADFCPGTSPHCCVLKKDQDSDKDDWYLDEWEGGMFGGCPDGVRSRITANWGKGINDVVSKDVGCNAWNGASP